MTRKFRVAFAMAMAVAVSFAGTAVAAGAVASTTAENVDNGQVSPSTVEEGSSVDHTVSFHVDSVSNDGSTDTFYVEFPNEADVSVNGATVVDRSDGSSISISSSPEVVDGPDDDGVKDTIAFAISPSGSAESVDVNATVSVSADWSAVDGDTTRDVYAAVEDSSMANVDRTSVASVTIQDTGTEPTSATGATSDGSQTSSDDLPGTYTTSANGGVDDGSGGSPGFGLAVAALAISLAAGLAKRRS